MNDEISQTFHENLKNYIWIQEGFSIQNVFVAS